MMATEFQKFMIVHFVPHVATDLCSRSEQNLQIVKSQPVHSIMESCYREWTQSNLIIGALQQVLGSRERVGLSWDPVDVVVVQAPWEAARAIATDLQSEIARAFDHATVQAEMGVRPHCLDRISRSRWQNYQAGENEYYKILKHGDKELSCGRLHFLIFLQVYLFLSGSDQSELDISLEVMSRDNII